MSRYNFKETEAKWQGIWADRRCFEAREESDRPKYYALEMFPYPSGRIHMGHVRNYTLGDVVARYKRARGFNVLHPMGWDSFGLPAENAAMENNVHPAKWTRENIAAMRAQFQSMGFSLDWSRELSTCEPDYYKHGQRLFLDLLKAGLAYQRESWVNWDPVENSVLANEQVIEGKGWRTGAPVEKRLLRQWFLKITAFSDSLLDGIETLERWPEKVRLMQHNWIGRSEGARIGFALEGREDRLEVFTTRPDTLFGASFCAIAANHPLAQELAGKDAALADFIAACNRMGTSEEAIEKAEKLGHDTGLRAVHPFVPGKALPVYVANFVLMEYGTGAIFGCPGHDQRDLEFARKYDLPVVPVVAPRDADPSTFAVGDTAFVDDGVLINSDFLNGKDVPAAKRAAIDRLVEQGEGESAGSRYGPAGAAPRRRGVRRRGQPAGAAPDLEECRLPRVRRRGPAGDRYLRYVLRFLLVLPALLLAAGRRRSFHAGRGGLLDAGGPVYRRRRARGAAPALFALLHPGAETLRLSRHRRAVRRPVHAGYGLSRNLPRRRRPVALPERSSSR
jgi:leucyl-tRNA synthetase